MTRFSDIVGQNEPNQLSPPHTLNGVQVTQMSPGRGDWE